MQNVIIPLQAIAPANKKNTCKKLWVLKAHFLKISGITDANFRQYKSYWNKKNATCWVIEKRSDGIYIDVNTIPKRGDYITCNDANLMEQVAMCKLEDLQVEDVALNTDINNAHYLLMKAKAENFQPIYNQINEKYNLTTDNCKEFAQRWAVWQYVLENPQYSLTVIFEAYRRIYPNHIGDKNSFCNYRKAIKDKGIEAKIIDQRAVSKAAKRISAKQEGYLQSLYIQPQKISAAKAAKRLVIFCREIGEKPYSKSSVQGYFRHFENNPELYTQRYGAAAAQKQLPFASLLPAEHRNTQWQADGVITPFWANEFDRYVIYVVLDNHSRKVVGYSVGLKENGALIMQGLDDAISNTGMYPAELITDKHGFTQSKDAGRLMADTGRMGAVWTVTTNAQRNGLVERYNQYLDEICKDFEGYLGKNMTATGKDARPAPEVMSQLARKSQFKTKDEIMGIMAYVVIEYNRSPLDLLGNIAPNDKYAASEDKKCFVINDAARLKLLNPIKEYKVQRGQINIIASRIKHEFQLPAALIARYNNKVLHVIYEDLEQGIYISDPKTGEELGSVAPKQKIHGAIADQTEADRKKLHQITGRTNGVTKGAQNSTGKNMGGAKGKPGSDRANSQPQHAKRYKAAGREGCRTKKETGYRGHRCRHDANKEAQSSSYTTGEASRQGQPV